MRIPIREQLAFLVVLGCLVGLAVISVAVWINEYNFVTGITSKELALAASLKAAQVAANIVLLDSICGTIVTRILIQQALIDFYKGNTSASDWVAPAQDLQNAMSSIGSSSQLLQAIIFPRNQTGNTAGLLNVTASSLPRINLPYTYDNGTTVLLGDPGIGYPPQLYPNLTYVKNDHPDLMDPSINATTVYAFPTKTLGATSSLLLGPLQVNETFAMVSLTLPILYGSNQTEVLGYLTVVADAAAIFSTITSKEGLGDTGVTLLIGPSQPQNRFPTGDKPTNATYQADKSLLETTLMNFVFPPVPIPGQTDRHSEHSMTIGGGPAWELAEYPAVLDAYYNTNPAPSNSSSSLSTHNEHNMSVSVGYAIPQTTIVNWVLVIELAHSEAWSPIVELRHILLACVFGTLGFILLVIVPVAHCSVRPIRALRDAAGKTVQPPGYTPSSGSAFSDSTRMQNNPEDPDNEDDIEEGGMASSSREKKKNKGFMVRMKKIGGKVKKKTRSQREEDNRRRVFKIPGKVPETKHWITDELTELTATFNEMSEELVIQYSSLEARVAERTRELEISKKAAEAANESKTLFIANISHELKTPLNGILGMCAVCMGEDDLPKIKKSLSIVYKSGDLLLHLLNDLLTFSRNQMQQISLEEREFRLDDIKSQVTTIFDKQARDGKISFDVKYMPMTDTEPKDNLPTVLNRSGQPSPNSSAVRDGAHSFPLPLLGPTGTGRMKDMCLWGDQHRILQVLINLVSNSLKFTPAGGKVQVRIKCLGEMEKSEAADSRQDSMNSRTSSARYSRSQQRSSRGRHRLGSNSDGSQDSKRASATAVKPAGTALLINPMDPKATPHVQLRERSPTPPPSNARTLLFQFEVEDTGPGIPESFQQSVFEPFVQADLGLSKKYGGTGLGLSICSQLATLMGGNIQLESTVGVGTTFNMKIPLKFVKEKASSQVSDSNPVSRSVSAAPSLEGRDINMVRRAETPPGTIPITGTAPVTFDTNPQPRLVGLSQPFFATPPTAASASTSTSKGEQLAAIERIAANRDDGSKVRVLVAEDNLVNQEVVLRMLKLEDIYDVVVAKDGQEAFDMVKVSMEQGIVFNLIFMDVQMPNLDGLQSTRLIREMGYKAPIVALTAFSEESNVKECYDSGMDWFVSKPIRRPALKQVLKKFATIHEEPEHSPTLNRRPTFPPAAEQSTATLVPGANGRSSAPQPERSQSDPAP